MSGRIRFWGIVMILAVAAIAGGVVYYLLTREVPAPSEEKGMEFVQESAPEGVYEEEEPVPAGLTTEAVDEYAKEEETTGAEYEYVLVSENNYVVVYQLPQREIYEYTDIILDVLPEEVRQEILAEKYLRNEEELYNFLENYTS